MEHSFSVVIPARNAASDLGECLASILGRSGEPPPREVIVVDDGSTDGTAAMAEARGARVIHLAGLGPAAARNAGARAASGDVLVFLDADCVPEEGCFEALVAPFADPQVAGTRGGYTSRQPGLLPRFVQLEMEEKQSRLAASARVTLLDTACAAYRRDLFLEQGGFDEGLPATSVEDAEFSFRLAAQGRRLVYAPEARVRHRHPEQLGSYLRRKLRFGYYRARLYRRYPGRVREDGYTPRLMPLQIALSGVLAGAAAAGVPFAPARPVAAAAGLLFLATALPLVARAWPGDRGLAVAVPPLLLARSLAQGVGLLAGLASQIAGSPDRDRLKPRFLDRAGAPSGGMRILGALLTLAALGVLGIVLARSDWRELIRPLLGARWEWLVAAVALAFGVEVAKTLRWQLLLGLPPADLPRVLALVIAGRLLNVLAPLRAGDLWRVASAAKGEGRSLTLAGGSVVAEKLLDAAGLGGAALGLLLPLGHRGLLGVVAGGLGAAAALGILGMGVRTGQRLGLSRWLAGAEPLRDPRRLAAVGTLTLLGLGLGLMVNLAVLQALAFPVGLTLGVAMLVSGYATALVPAGPGQLGVFELAVATPLIALGFSPASAVAAALTLHLVLLSMLLLAGLVALPLGLAGRRV